MSRGIPLTQGRVAIVDENLYDWLNQYKWYACWQPCTRQFVVVHQKAIKKGTQRPEYMHRVIMGAQPGQQVDHKNHDPLDNRLCNLRFCTYSQNKINSRKALNNTSGFKGVSWHKRDKVWQGYIAKDGKTIHLGYFDDPVKAAIAYNDKATELFGEFANLNDIPQEIKA